MAGRPKKIAKEFDEYSTRDASSVAALQLSAEKGPSKLKLREIARRVGVEPASIYNHFSGLSGILSEVIRSSLAEEKALLDLPPNKKGREAMAELCLRSTKYFAANEGLVRLSLNDFAEVHHQNPNAFDENVDDIVGMLDLEAVLIAQHLDLGNLSRQRLGEIAISRRSMIMTLLSVTWLNGKQVDAKRIKEIADLATAFMLGLPSQMGQAQT